MKKLSVEEMHCEKCVERISNLMEKNNVKGKVSLADKTVEVDLDDKGVEEFREMLEDIGFDSEIV